MGDDASDGRASTLDWAGRIVVVTGAGQGIGRALVDRFVADGAALVVALDRDPAALRALVADRHDPRVAIRETDVRDADGLERTVRWVEEEFGRIDVFCSNAGVMASAGVDAAETVWQTAWDVNVMAHVHAARLVLPGMLSRSSGVLLNVVSAAGLLSAPDSVPYTVTKHAALGLAEVLAMTCAGHGITVTAVCPEAVDTPMLHAALADPAGTAQRVSGRGVISADQVAADAVAAALTGRFLVTTHPRTLGAVQKKWADVDAWVQAMGLAVNRRK